MIRLLIDCGLPRNAALLLREAGIDAVHAGEVGASTASDDHILQMGRDEHRVIVTLDSDFHALLALSSASSPSVIRIRVEGLRGPAAAYLIRTVVDLCAEELIHGAMVTVQENRLRIRTLPLIT